MRAAAGQKLRSRVEELVCRRDDRRRAGAGHAHVGRRVDARAALELAQKVLGRQLVQLEHRVGAPAPLGAVRPHKRDVDMTLGEKHRQGGEDAGLIAVRDEEGVVLARDIDIDPVDAAHPHAAAAEALAPDLDLDAARILHRDVDRVGMQARVIAADRKRPGEPRRLGVREGVADALVVRLEPQDACHERPIGAVAAVGVGEAVVERKAHAQDTCGAQRRGDARQAERTRRMRAGGADHNGAEDLESGKRGHGRGLSIAGAIGREAAVRSRSL